MENDATTPTLDLVLAELRKGIGTVLELTIRKKTGRFKILNARVSKTGFAFDFKSTPATIDSAFEYRLQDMETGRKFWSPPFSAKLKEPPTKS